jgi:hypothetical protein
MPAERGEQERRDLIRRLELEYQEAESKLRKASHAHSMARANRHNAEARLFRAQSPPDGSDFCLLCWVNHQRLSYLRLVPSPEARLTDRWTCESADCGYTEDQRTELRPARAEGPQRSGASGQAVAPLPGVSDTAVADKDGSTST